MKRYSRQQIWVDAEYGHNQFDLDAEFYLADEVDADKAKDVARIKELEARIKELEEENLHLQQVAWDG